MRSKDLHNRPLPRIARTEKEQAAAMQWLAGKLGGEFSESPEEMFEGLSAGAWELLKAACEGAIIVFFLNR